MKSAIGVYHAIRVSSVPDAKLQRINNTAKLIGNYAKVRIVDQSAESGGNAHPRDDRGVQLMSTCTGSLTINATLAADVMAKRILSALFTLSRVAESDTESDTQSGLMAPTVTNTTDGSER